MTIKQTVGTALDAVLENSWAVELPPSPTWPAIVFEIDTTPEQNWVQGGGYEQHVITVVSLAKTVEELDALRPQIVAAMEPVAGFMGAEEEGDSEYEGDPEVYAYFQNFRIRTPV